MDTADFNAENILPQVIENYDGGVIPLGQSGFNLDPADFSSLHKYKGQTLRLTEQLFWEQMTSQVLLKS